MNWDSFIAGAMAMNILWTLIHWWFPRKVEHLTEISPQAALSTPIVSSDAE